MPKNKQATLEKIIGYQFKNKDHLKLALSHRSVGDVNNERLEFLGDALLSSIIAEALYKKLENSPEGDLSRMRATLVKGETLAEIALEFKLGGFLHLGSGELKSGGFKRPTILAGTVEAIIGAIYFDSNYITCQSVVMSWYQERLENLKPISQHKDSKTRLQEYLQSKKQELPMYTLDKVEGEDHDQVFYASCLIESLSLKTSASGPTRRRAEQEAARLMLDKLSEL